MAEAGWYPDPRGSANQRWFDGVQWTESLLEPTSAVPVAVAPQYAPPVAQPPQYPATAVYGPAQPISSGLPVTAEAAAPFAWWWIVGAVVLAAPLSLVGYGPGLFGLVAAYLVGAGVAMTRSRPAALGLLWGLVSPVLYFGFVFLDEGFARTELVDAALWGIAAAVVVAVPAMAAAPRGKAWLGAAAGAFPGAVITAVAGATDHLEGPAYGVPFLLAALGVLAIGGRPQLKPRTPKAQPYPVQQYAPGQYPQPGYYQAPPSTNGFAITSLVLGILGISVLGLVFGFIARSQVKRTGQGGAGMALAGIILSFIWLALTIGFYVAIFAVANSSSSYDGLAAVVTAIAS